MCVRCWRASQPNQTSYNEVSEFEPFFANPVPMNLLKATTPTNSSSSLVISFNSRWQNPLLEGRISVVVRKRGPRAVTPDWIYVYINQPVSGIVARLPVNRFEWKGRMNPELCRQALLTRQELLVYSGDEPLAVFHVGAPIRSSSVVDLRTLSSRFGFFPPQSFFILSASGKQHIDELCGF
jgi:predicted transcriptional regulator